MRGLLQKEMEGSFVVHEHRKGSLTKTPIEFDSVTGDGRCKRAKEVVESEE